MENETTKLFTVMAPGIDEFNKECQRLINEGYEIESPLTVDDKYFYQQFKKYPERIFPHFPGNPDYEPHFKPKPNIWKDLLKKILPIAMEFVVTKLKDLEDPDPVNIFFVVLKDPECGVTRDSEVRKNTRLIVSKDRYDAIEQIIYYTDCNGQNFHFKIGLDVAIQD